MAIVRARLIRSGQLRASNITDALLEFGPRLRPADGVAVAGYRSPHEDQLKGHEANDGEYGRSYTRTQTRLPSRRPQITATALTASALASDPRFGKNARHARSL
jgi:hypothetical protein